MMMVNIFKQLTKQRGNKMNFVEKYESLSDKQKVELLWLALDYMNQYNGRTKTECLTLAMEDIYGSEASPLHPNATT